MANVNVINELVFSIAAVKDCSVRMSCNLSSGALKKSFYTPEKGVSGNAEIAAVTTAALTLSQLADKKESSDPDYKANITLWMPDQAAKRLITIMSICKKNQELADVEILQKCCQSWMPAEYKKAVAAYINQYMWLLGEEDINIAIEQVHHANYWLVEGKGLKDGMELSLEKGKSKNGKILCEPFNDRVGNLQPRQVTYKGKVERYEDKKGAVSYRLIRVGNPNTEHGKGVIFTQKLVEETYKYLNEVKPKKVVVNYDAIDFGKIEYSEEV